MKPEKLMTLHQRILRGFGFVVGINLLLSATMVLIAYVTCDFVPKLMRDNYSSISDVAAMNRTWQYLRHPNEELDDFKDLNQALGNFDQALENEFLSISEPGEQELVEKIKKLWVQSKQAPQQIPERRFKEMKGLLEEIVALNQRGMLRISVKAIGCFGSMAIA